MHPTAPAATRHRTRQVRALAPIPPGHEQAFAALGMALGVAIDTTTTAGTGWEPWQAVTRAKGWHVARQRIDGSATEILLNSVRGVKLFRLEANATEAAAKLNQGAT